jgi:hypothetical protein
MVVLAGGILLALFIIMVLVGRALTIRDGVRAARRNARAIAICLLVLDVAGRLFGVITALRSFAAPYTAQSNW